MKIIVIGPTAPYKGGISHFNTLLCKTLKKRHNTHLISWKRRFPEFFSKIDQLDKASKAKLKIDARFILDSLNPFSWFKVYNIIKKEEADLLIFHWVTPFLSPVFFTISFLVKHFTKTKILLVGHNIMPHERRLVDVFLTKLVFSQVDFFLLHSKKDKEDLVRLKKNANFILGFHPTYEVFNMRKMDSKHIRKKLKLKKKVILFFGYIRDYKGLSYLIKAMPMILKKIDLDLLIVGEFWGDKEKYIDLIDSLGINNNVKLVGRYVPNEEVGRYFSVADVVVLPYTSSTQSGIIQIAFGFNKPVITTNVGGLPDVIKESETGFLVKPRDSVMLAKSVIKFYKEEKNKLLVRNIIKEKKRFSWQKYVVMIEGFVK